MFKKSNRNFRIKKATESDSDEADTKTSPTKPTLTEVTHVAVTKSVVIAPHKALSFHDAVFDENEDQESNSANEAGSASKEFRVKKSKESRRITKELKKSKKDKERMLKMEVSSSNTKQGSDSSIQRDTALTADTILFNEGIKGILNV